VCSEDENTKMDGWMCTVEDIIRNLYRGSVVFTLIVEKMEMGLENNILK